MTDADLDRWRLVHRCELCARETPYELVEAWEIGSGTAYCRHCGQYGPLHFGNPKDPDTREAGSDSGKR